MDSNELYHYGVKGMKWGVRKQQYDSPDGVPVKRNPVSSKDLKAAKRIVEKAGTKVEQAKVKRSTEKKITYNEQIKTDLKKMSDAELRDVVNRLNMEERYTAVMQSRYTEVGRSKTDALLDRIGTAVKITGSALSMAIAIKELSK